MDTLKAEHEKLLKKGNLNKSINDVQKTIDLLVKARAQVAEGASKAAEPHARQLTRPTDPASAQMTLAKLQAPAKQSFEKVNDDLKEVHQALGKYGKALDKVGGGNTVQLGACPS